MLRRSVCLMEEEEFLLHEVSCSIRLCIPLECVCQWNFAPQAALDSSALASISDTSKSLDSRINLECKLVHSERPFSLADKGNCLKPRAVSVDVGCAVEQLLRVVFVPIGGL